MAKIKGGAGRDLFDLGSESMPGNRQTDLEDLIAEKSLWDAIRTKDCKAEAELVARAKRGEIIRIM